MTSYLVRTPVADYTGDVGSIHFKDGTAVVSENAQEINYLRAAGYGFEELDAPMVVADVDGDGVVEELPKKTAPVAEWRAFAVAHGLTEAEADAMTKEALIAHYTPKEGS